MRILTSSTFIFVSAISVTGFCLSACASSSTTDSAATASATTDHREVRAAGRTPSNAAPSSLNNGAPWKADDPALKSGDLTVWKLQEMAQNHEFDALDALFDHGLTMATLPQGYAAGRGARVLDTGGDIGKFLVAFTGASWHGKIFYHSDDPTSSHGLNRIRQTLGDDDSPIVPMGAFTTQLLTQHELAPTVTSNFVVLNYANPASRPDPYFQEKVLKIVQVYDVMVAVPGKYGPIYVGKTWLGHYDADKSFHTPAPHKLIARYFLDFNQAALDEQKRREEVMIDPGPKY